jgi:uncharacterized iron-regulated membrane protein
MTALIRDVVLPVHRWTSLTLGVLVLWMALTGLGLLFRMQLDPAVNRQLEMVPACRSPLSLDEQLASARRAHPQGTLRLIGVEGSVTRSSWVRFANGDTVYVDPCSGRVLGELNKFQGVFGTLEYLHRLEFLSSVSHVAAGSAALIFALIILIGGLAIWWPASLQGLRWSITFRRRPVGRARLLRIHRAAGFWVCLIALCSALTGPVDSFSWYRRAIQAVTDSSPRSPKPAMVAARHGPRLTFQELWQRAREVAPDPREVLLLVPGDLASAVELDLIERSAPNHQAVSFLYLDPYSGRVLAFQPYATSGIANKIMTWGIAIHAGEAGIPAQMALLAGVLGISVLAYTGFSSYIRRRVAARRGRTSATLRPLNRAG